MKYLSCFIFVVSVFGVKAQSNNKHTMEGDSLNATFVQANMLSNLELAIINGVDFIELSNVNEPTEVMIYDLNGKVVFKMKIEHKTRIDKDNFARGFYIIKTRSVKKETIKKLYI